MPPESRAASGAALETVGSAPFESAGRALRWVFLCTGVPVALFANLAQLAPLSLALTCMGLFVVVAVSLTFVLVPERAARLAIHREESP